MCNRHIQLKSPFIPASIILALFISLAGCGKGPTKYEKENSLPETTITSKTLSKVVLEMDSTGAVTNLGQFSFVVEYSGTDLDGTVDSFAVRVDGGVYGAWTTRQNFTGTVDFTSGADEHTVEVKSKDNEGQEDPTPAMAVLSLAEIMANDAPTTAFFAGPGNGATTGGGVSFGVNGKDEGGEVVNFIYSVDGGAEQNLTPDEEGNAIIEFSTSLGNALSPGTHTVTVRSVDNLGAEDPTPISVSFFVATGLKPLITQADGPPPGGGWFTGANIPFAVAPTTGHYFGVIDHYEYSVDDPVNFISTPSSSIPLEPQSAGQHTFRVRAVDTGGGVSDVLEVMFDVAAFVPTEGILFIDNMNFNPSSAVYADEPDIDQQVLDGFFSNFSQVSVWDVDNLSGDLRYPGAVNSEALPGPSDLAQYSSVVAMTDGGYALSDISALLAAYFQAGGNLMITGYASVNFAQVLKDVMGTPTVFNGFGTNLASLEGFSETGGNNSGDYAFISGDDVVPVIPGVTNRSWEITTNDAPRSLRVMFGNVFEGDGFPGFRVATEVMGDKGNYGLWIGVSMGYLDQKSTGIVKLGDFVLGDRFGEVKNP